MDQIKPSLISRPRLRGRWCIRATSRRPDAKTNTHRADRVVTFDQRAIDNFSLELHQFDIRPQLVIEPFRRLLYKALKPLFQFIFRKSNAELKEAQLAAAKRQDAHNNRGMLRCDLGGTEVFAPTPEADHVMRNSEWTVVDKFGRVIVAFVGGASLLVPMILMSIPFKNEPKARVVTVSIAVTVFGIVLAISTKASYQEVVGATAAYTTVLVVYIGSASP